MVLATMRAPCARTRAWKPLARYRWRRIAAVSRSGGRQCGAAQGCDSTTLPHTGSPMPDATSPATHVSPALEVTALAKRVPLPSGVLTILDDTGFAVGAAASVALVGALGSGKSRQLSVMAGPAPPRQGN